jgi:hypothetical protein
MRRFRPLCILALAAILPACAPAPFSMQNSYLGIEPQTNHQILSYYLPKTILKATVTGSATTRNLSTGSEKIVDRHRSFRINYVNSIVHDDDIEVETDDKGFLKKVKAHSDDKTAEIVKKAADIFMTTIDRTQRALGTAPLTENELAVTQFDPFDADDFAGQNAILHSHGFCFAVFDRKGRPLPGSCSAGGVVSGGDAERNADVTADYSGSGFFYRRPAEHRVVIYRKSGKAWRAIWAGWHPFEQQADLHEVRIDRGNFIHLKADLTFTDGNLEKFQLKKPSELLGFMKIPATIVNTIVQIPGAQVTGLEKENEVKEKELAAREKALQLRERELKLVPAGVASDGRQIYVPAGGTPRFAESNTQGNGQGETGQGQLEAEKQRFMARCGDQPGLNAQDCEAAWSRRNM